MPTLIGLCGAARAGKSTAASFLTEHMGYQEYSYAGPIRTFMRDLLNVDVNTYENIKDKPHALLGGNTPRYAMQTLGTEWGRNTLSDTLWIDVCMNKVNSALHRHGTSVVVSDVRFPNEAEAIRAAGGKIIQILRAGGPGIQDNQHVSENGIPQHMIDTIIINDGSLEDFKIQLIKYIDF